ncbi:uncharacterized protein V1516DRAFT_487580 [Lipomyces oligophaga]|uniref:uncharacterized protein n=1 Tax=Lipomyces oligophaga TaxID=45792 RepID=UPI0034CD96BD
MSSSLLFSPVTVGRSVLQHRIALAPLTRFRNGDDGSPVEDLSPVYYSQRSTEPGTFLISEATDIASFSGGYSNVPGLYSEAQIAGWKMVTAGVHRNKGTIFAQIWALGRVNPGTVVKDIIGPSAIASEGLKTPRALTLEEIVKFEDAFVSAARNAITAGFDGVEIHGAHGYLIDQFIQDMSNQRADEYGGSIENRARFLLNIIDKVSAAIGADRTAVRLSPFSQFQSMKMQDPVPQFSYIISQIAKSHPDLAYIHMVEPRVSGDVSREVQVNETTDVYRSFWPGVWITAGGYTKTTAEEYLERHPQNTLVAFGREFISNPDLVARFRQDISLTAYDRSTFYIPKEKHGYTDYPFAK